MADEKYRLLPCLRCDLIDQEAEVVRRGPHRLDVCSWAFRNPVTAVIGGPHRQARVCQRPGDVVVPTTVLGVAVREHHLTTAAGMVRAPAAVVQPSVRESPFTGVGHGRRLPATSGRIPAEQPAAVLGLCPVSDGYG
jgi:hypothetical protein